MDAQTLSWALGIVGLTGFYFAGKRVWWSWYINLGCQALWFSYAYVTSTPAFAVTALAYTIIFGINAHRWTKEEISKRKIARGNISENGNSRRSSIYGRRGKWREPRPVGEQQRSDDGDSC